MKSFEWCSMTNGWQPLHWHILEHLTFEGDSLQTIKTDGWFTTQTLAVQHKVIQKTGNIQVASSLLCFTSLEIFHVKET